MTSSYTHESQTPPVAKDGIKSILSVVLIFLLAPLTALFLTAFVFQSYQVDGPSMEPTLQNSDRLIVSKLPRTWARITGGTYIPERGEIVVFHRTSVQGFGSSDKQLIKRVIALPGERVVVRGGVLTVFNESNPEGFQPDELISDTSAISGTQGEVDLTVGENEVFVSGDNRGNSLDSRSFGPIAAKDIVGTLSYRIFPFDQVRTF